VDILNSRTESTQSRFARGNLHAGWEQGKQLALEMVGNKLQAELEDKQ
jgi:hypothetical protein